jgi:hypothetical protein
MDSSNEPSDHPAKPTGRPSYRLTILCMLAMVLTAGVLVLAAEFTGQTPCWGFFIVVSLIAWPVWRYRTEYILLRRRSILTTVTRPQSCIRAWLWNGNLSRIFQVPVSFALAWLLLALVSGLSPHHWKLLAVDAALLALLIVPVSRRLAGQLSAQYLNTIARHWPLLAINGIVLTGAIMTLDFFLVGAADSRHLQWHQVAVQAFKQINDQAGCILWGLTAGLLAAGEALAWHASELVIPNLPDTGARVVAWLLFLLRAATVAFLYTVLLLGVSVFVEKQTPQNNQPRAGNTVARAFLLTIIVLALPFFYAAIKLHAIDPAVFEKGLEDTAELINPCKPDSAARDRLVARLENQVRIERQRAMEHVDTGVDAGLEQIFARVEKGVDNYLDWYFSVAGEYQRLAAVLFDDFVDVMRDQLEQHLFAAGDFDVRLTRLNLQIEQDSAARLASIAPRLGTELKTAPCDVGGLSLAPLSRLDQDALRASAAATGGIGAGIVASKALAKKTAAAVAGKLAAKTLAKKGSSSLLSAGIGATLCAPGGPVAILCGVTAGLVTWLAVDKVLIELDDALHRDEMRQDILDALAEQQLELGNELRQKHYTHIDTIAARLNDAVQETFIPYEHGGL